MRFCSKCGNEIPEGMQFCNKCGAKIESFDINEILREDNTQSTSNQYQSATNKKVNKFHVGDVINKEDIISSTNKVAYIAKGWAYQVRKRGEIIAGIIGAISFFTAFNNLYSASSFSEPLLALIIAIITGLILGAIIVAIFNTTAFVIRMVAEIIQLLDDIKNK